MSHLNICVSGATMFSVPSLREFINKRLTAAAEEIFTEFEKTIFQYEEVIDRQRRLLDTNWKPQIRLYRIDVPQQHVCKEEDVLCEQQIPNQERNSGLDQERNSGLIQERNSRLDQKRNSHLDQERNSGLIQERNSGVVQERNSRLDQERNSGLDQERNSGLIQERNSGLVQERNSGLDQERNSGLDQERSSSLVQNSHLDQEKPEPPQIKKEQDELCSSQEGKQLVLKQETETFMLTPTYQESDFSEPELKPDQLHCQNSPLTENPNQDQSKNLDSGSTTDGEMNLNKRHGLNRTGSINVDPSSVSPSQSEPQSGKRCVKCDVCGKTFRHKSCIERHYRIHTGDKPYDCKVCGKRFAQKGTLVKHVRIHTGERPYDCKTCGKCFTQSSSLLAHLKVHTGEKPFSCMTCGKNFPYRFKLLIHMRVHTGERPYSCGICGKDFTQRGHMRTHMTIHLREKC